MTDTIHIGAAPSADMPPESTHLEACQIAKVVTVKGKLQVVIETEMADAEQLNAAKTLIGLYAGRVDVTFTGREDGGSAE